MISVKGRHRHASPPRITFRALIAGGRLGGRVPGTAALRIVADDETSELESATIVGQFGKVPDDFVVSLRSG